MPNYYDDKYVERLKGFLKEIRKIANDIYFRGDEQLAAAEIVGKVDRALGTYGG